MEDVDNGGNQKSFYNWASLSEPASLLHILEIAKEYTVDKVAGRVSDKLNN
jgi:hypothetical protein